MVLVGALMRSGGILPVEDFGIPVCSQREERNERNVTDEEDPAEEGGPGEDEVKDQDGREEQGGLPGVKSRSTELVSANVSRILLCLV